MLDVARWLAEQELGHYAEAFAENGIAGDVLRDLTDADLKELGINLGDRKRLLRAIAALDAGPARDRTAEPSKASVASREAERRQLTLMFVDLVGSTELAARLDPEDLSRVIRAYQEHCAEVVERWGGHIAKYMGDGCSPISLSGGVRGRRRAGSAGGLAIIDALTRLETPAGEPLAARIGIATGLVMVWELIGEGVAQERGRRDAQSGGSIAGARRAGQCRDQPR